MSLLSSREVRLTLAPDRVRASAWRGRFRPEQVAEAAITLAPGERDLDAQAWALQRALEQLAATTPLAGSALQVEMADSLLHFDVAEGEFAGLAARTLSSFADACVAELLDERTAEHTVRWQLQRDERHLLVCAMPTRQLELVGTAAATHRLALGGIRPRFVRQWNEHLARQRVDDAVFVVAEDRQALIACVRAGAITALSSGPWFADRNEFSDSTVERLLAGIGLLGKDCVALIDLQVDRLLAGLGIDPAGPSAYVLVSADEPHTYLSNRWAVRRPWGERP